jgi:predicted nuclease of predicted toxin-antitoxin system
VIRFLIDAQLPPALAQWIVAAGHEAQHVADFGMSRAPDRAIWDHAERTNAVIVTKDEDFARLKSLGAEGPKIVWVRWPNTRRRELLARFEVAFPMLLQALQRGEALVEII